MRENKLKSGTVFFFNLNWNNIRRRYGRDFFIFENRFNNQCLSGLILGESSLNNHQYLSC